MSIFPPSPNVGDQFSGYEWDGTAWTVIGIDLNQDYALSSELTTALADTTGVHGITDTSTLATQTYADTTASNQISTHNATVTSVHGIADTTLLETQSGAQAKADAAETAANSYTDTTVSTHNIDTTSVHGISDTSALVVTTDSRLSDARTPTAHAASHASGGADAITVTQSQVTNLTSDLALKAPLASPALTGVPTAPTAAAGTNTTQLATTEFVQSAIPSGMTLVNSYSVSPPNANTSTSTTFVDSGMTLTVTPTSATSLFLMVYTFTLDGYSFPYGSNSLDDGGELQVLRDSTVLKTLVRQFAITAQSGTVNLYFHYNTSPSSLVLFDSPATTSSVSYKMQFRLYNTQKSPYIGMNNQTFWLLEFAA